MKIVLTGGTGFIGANLARALEAAGHSIVLLSRNGGVSGQDSGKQLRVVEWDALNAGPWMLEFEGADAVYHLAGQSVIGRRWTPMVKQSLIDSRVRTAELVVDAIQRAENRPRLLVSASAVGYYGDTGDTPLYEIDKPGNDFLARLCADWEAAAAPIQSLGVRLATPRIGLVLGRDGGAFPKMLRPFKMYVGGPFGNGRQWFPWVHIDDVVQALLFPLQNEKFAGAYNLSAPGILRNRDFCKALGKALSRPSFMAVPAFVLRLVLGEAASAVLAGQRVAPDNLRQAGFTFRFPDVESALADLLPEQ